MSSHDRWKKTGQGDYSLRWRLKSWVDRRLSPEDGRQRLMMAASAPPKAWRSTWKRVYIRRIRPLLPNRAAVPFTPEELIFSLTISAPLQPGLVFCT